MNTRKKIKFILLVAVSLDGYIANGEKEGSEWTSPEDKKFFFKELDKCDVAIMGRKTFDAIKRPLTPRNRVVFTHQKTFRHSAEYENVLAFAGSVSALLSFLKKQSWKRVAIVGGTSIYDWFLKQNLVDEVYLTIEPVLFGTGKTFTSRILPVCRKSKLVSVRKLNTKGTLLLHYKH